MMQYIWKYMRKDQKGFTLVELLVVVVILGILATLAVQSLGDRAGDARKNKALADLRTLVSALEIYKIDTGGYPVTGGTPAPATDLAALTPNYLKSLPTVTTYTATATTISEIIVTVGSGSALKTATYSTDL